MNDNFWWVKLEENMNSKEEIRQTQRSAELLGTMYKSLISEGFKPNDALYLLAEIIKGGRK